MLSLLKKQNCTASQDELAQTAPWNCCFLPGDYVFPGAVAFLLPSSCFHPVLCLFRVQDKNICMARPLGPGMRKAAGLYLLVCHAEMSRGDRHFLQKRQQVCLMVKYLKRRKRKQEKRGKGKEEEEVKGEIIIHFSLRFLLISKCVLPSHMYTYCLHAWGPKTFPEPTRQHQTLLPPVPVTNPCPLKTLRKENKHKLGSA